MVAGTGDIEMLILLALALAPQVVLEVTPDGPYRTIAAAVAAAPRSATVRVAAGVWREPTIEITEAITLEGMPGAVLDGEGERELLVVRGGGVIVRGFTFRNTGTTYSEDRAALHVDGAWGCLIEQNRFEETFFAIYLSRVEGCTVRDNLVVGTPGTESATGNAIHSWGSRNLRIERNDLRGHRDGIYLEFTRHATVHDNVSTGHFRYGLHFMYADSSTYARNRFVANGSGVAVMYSRGVVMHDNDFSGNRGPTAYGLLLKEITDAVLARNRFINNTTGILADGAERVEVRENRFESNGWAIRLLASTSGGRFLANTFVGNAFDVTVNGRGTLGVFKGNRWDSYRGWDLDADGTGDVAHYPVRFFALLVERAPVAMLLQRSLFVRVLDAAERVLPVLTPRGVVDEAPQMLRADRGGAE